MTNAEWLRQISTLGRRCRFCGFAACAVFSMGQGCVCYPEDREQALCPHHVLRATPLGSMEKVAGPGLPPWYLGSENAAVPQADGPQ
jgi:hypothetical protein